MPIASKASRTQVWMDSLGEWSWPGQGAVAAEVLPPPWVPAFPPRLEPAASPATPLAGGGRPPGALAAEPPRLRGCAPAGAELRQPRLGRQLDRHRELLLGGPAPRRLLLCL